MVMLHNIQIAKIIKNNVFNKWMRNELLDYNLLNFAL